LFQLIYRKSLTASKTGKAKMGELVNLMAVDIQRIADVMVSWMYLFLYLSVDPNVDRNSLVPQLCLLFGWVAC
jgi:hypothetical protein